MEHKLIQEAKCLYNYIHIKYKSEDAFNEKAIYIPINTHSNI